MAKEIERKFLMEGSGWRDQTISSERLVDGLLATSKGRKVRIRLYAERATIAIKTARKGRVRFEFEYEIPRADAEQLIATQCGGNVLAKTRHLAPFQGYTWEVDVYEPPLDGVILAEIELREPNEEPPRPPWIGKEVTDDPAFQKRRLFANRARPKTYSR